MHADFKKNENRKLENILTVQLLLDFQQPSKIWMRKESAREKLLLNFGFRTLGWKWILPQLSRRMAFQSVKNHGKSLDLAQHWKSFQM